MESQEIRRTLQNLLPGSRYATRVRAVNEFGQIGPWSEAMEFTADNSGSSSGDLVAPSAPTVQPSVGGLIIIMNYLSPNDGISLYTLEHSLDNINFTTLAITQIPLYVHVVPSGTTHYYRYSITDIYGTTTSLSPSNSGQSIDLDGQFVPLHSQEDGSFFQIDYNMDLSFEQHVLEVLDENSMNTVYTRVDEFYVNIGSNIDNAQAYLDLWTSSDSDYAAFDVFVRHPSETNRWFEIYCDTDGSPGDGGMFLEVSDGTGAQYTLGLRMEGGFYVGDVDWDGDPTFIQLSVMGADPAAPAASGLRLYAKDDGGDEKLYTRRSDGTVVELGAGSGGEDPRVGSDLDGLIDDNDGGTWFVPMGWWIGDPAASLYTTDNASVGYEAIAGADRDTDAYAVAATWASNASYVSAVFNVYADDNVDSWGDIWGEARPGTSDSNTYFYVAQHDGAGPSTDWGGARAEAALYAWHTDTDSWSMLELYPSTGDPVYNAVLYLVEVDTDEYELRFRYPDSLNTVQVIGGNLVSPGGGADAFYEHTQGSGSSTWTVTHNLAKYPSVTTVDNSGIQIFGTVTYNSNNQVTVTFSSSQTGKAYCN